MDSFNANFPAPSNFGDTPPLDVRKTLRGKRMILLGATGFLGKVWLSLLLREYPEIGAIYMMVRPRKNLSPTERFWAETASSPVFEPIRSEMGVTAFEDMLREKIRPIGGDIMSPFLGLSDDERAELSGKVDVIVNVSGVVDFNPPLDEALNVNAFGAQNLIALARSLGDTPILHTSTCFVVGNRNGVTPERNPLDFPFPRADELDPSHWDADREIAECTDLVEQAKRRVQDAPRQSHLLDEAKQRLKARHEPLQGQALTDELDKVKRDFVRQRVIEAGKERAQFWGWPNIYTYTKSIGEQVLMRSGLPVTIVRPSIVESAVRYPETGWCEGISTSTPISYIIFQGHQNLPIGEHCHYDAIPVDMCAAGMIAALAALLERRHEPVYQLCSSDVNPLKTRRAAEFLGLAKRLHFKERSKGNPLFNQLQAHTEPMIVGLDRYRRFSAPAVHKAARGLSKLLKKAESTALEDYAVPLRKQVDAASRQIYNLSRVFDEFIPFIAGSDMRFSAKNTRALMASLAPHDQRSLHWSPETIDWRHFWMDIHIPGMKRWSFPLLKEKLKKDPKPLRRHDNLCSMLDDLGERHAHSVALQRLEGDELSRVTYGELLRRADAVAAALGARGIAVGDRVALGGQSHPSWAIAYFGILRAGGIAIPLDKDYDQARLENVLTISRAKFAILDDKIEAYSEQICARIALHDITSEKTASAPSEFRAHRPADDDLASILYTSGTTGEPKGVMLSHRNFTSLIAALAAIFPLDHRDRLLSVLPLHHTFEFSCGLLLPLSRGARVIYLDEVNGDRVTDGLSKGRVTSMVGVPALWELIERRIVNEVSDRGVAAEYIFNTLLDFNRSVSRNLGMDLGRVLFAPVHNKLGGRLRTLISGAAALPPDVYKTFQGLGLPLAEGYGLTEAAPVLTVAKKSLRSKGGHVGESIPGVEIKIQNPNDDGIGEIVARGPNVMHGYENNETATDEVLQEQWLKTGDLGKIDSRGRLKIVGRSKEVILSGSGENIYPDDIEQQLGTPEFIKELSIVGIPDQKQGELVACLAVIDSEPSMERAELHRKAQSSLRSAFDRLPRSTRPAFYRLIEHDLPRTATKKVQRKDVRVILERLRSAQEAMNSSSDTENTSAGAPRIEIRRAIAAITRRKLSELRPEHDIIADLGFDSLMVVELSAAIENQFPHLDSDRLGECRTIEELETLAYAKQSVAQSKARSRNIEKDEEDHDIEVPEILKTPVRLTLEQIQLRSFDTIFRTKVRGRANIPRNRACVVIANHNSHLDVGLIKYALGEYGKELISLGAEDYFFKDKWRRLYFENFTNVARLDRKHGLRKTITQAGEYIQSGNSVLLFPEGTRSTDGEIYPFMPLIGHLALTYKVDILPIYLKGTHRAYPKGATLPKPGVSLEARIGPVLQFDALERYTQRLKRSDAFREITRLAQEAVESLRDGQALDLDHLERSAQAAAMLPAAPTTTPTEVSSEVAHHVVHEDILAHRSANIRPSDVLPADAGAHTFRSADSPEKAPLAASQPSQADSSVISDPEIKVSTPQIPAPRKRESAMEKLMTDLQSGFIAGGAKKAVSFYISVGEASDHKWSIYVDPGDCRIERGKPPGGKADCVLKTNPEMFTRIVKEHYTPSFAEFVSGKVKTNDPGLLKVFKKVFAL